MKITLLLNGSYFSRRWLGIAALVCLSLFAQYAVADAGDTFNLTGGTTFLYDSNVFRLSPTVPPLLFTGRDTTSDLIITTTGALSVNKHYSMQRFEVNGSLVDNRYHNFDYLNFLGKNGTATWHWYVTPYLYGKLTGNHREALNNFADLTGFANSTNRNLRTDNNARFDAVLELDGAWRLIGGVSYDVRTNSRLTVQDFDNTVLSVEGGLRYAFPSGSSLTYKVRQGYGEFYKRDQPLPAQLFDNQFDEREHELRLMWPVTGKTSIDARVGHFARHHAHFPQRDFDGFVGNFNLNWAVTGQTRITAGWARDLFNFQVAPGQFQNSPFFDPFSASFASANRVFFAPVWQITEKVALRLRYDYSLRDYLGAVEMVPGGSRTDTQHSGLIALDWQPLRAVFLSGALQRDHRSSDHRGFDFDASSASVSARLNF
ncbi:exopolysaccharide biosynthesis operon protein EpsL [Nitrosospira sp. Nsp14]|uniref:XrtB/PEP-CTERM-associated polysaccharide biosynthesis outer membrane protein EpsL n=1 Tax=Nitrosospira sp. Nsp14 TaxID=1855333 RepID=UPI0008E2EE7A|nr:XrtB/PEP-CTERM-associated polysaccharide biosynthesis outer membrane protein EpsL [Nitrosospira sp. Nsp14]SFH17669.1 exopolysaccharide biosynthesis operon protein EpsL [Nitrosospira sp. Nsp14]